MKIRYIDYAVKMKRTTKFVHTDTSFYHRYEKKLLISYEQNGTDYTVHHCSLISVTVVRFLENWLTFSSM